MAARKNPVQRRLDLVHDEWVAFAELPAARVLCWQVTPDETSMVEAFVAVESDERGGELPDLFVRLLSPFDAATPYGLALRGEFLELARALHAGLDSPEQAAWLAPNYERGEDDVAFWVRTCASFSQHYRLPGLLATLLLPGGIADAGAYQLWLQRLAAQLPSSVRAVVLDDARTPGFATLVKAEPVRVVAKPLALDMPGARLELSSEAGGLETPGGQFRHLFVQLTNALGASKLPEAIGFAQAALGIAAAQRWFALAVPVQFSLGAAFAGQGRATEANERYLAAELAAAEGEKAGDPACTQLRAQARMVRGGLLVSIRQFPAAAQLFIETIPVAESTGDPRMVLDCYRLASFSYEQSGAHEKAWQTGIDGLGYAHKLDLETRQTTTLPYLGEGMMRLSQRPEYQAARLRIEREMVALTGRTDWQPKNGATVG
jgi:hypothetical protein